MLWTSPKKDANHTNAPTEFESVILSFGSLTFLPFTAVCLFPKEKPDNTKTTNSSKKKDALEILPVLSAVWKWLETRILIIAIIEK